MRIRWQIARKAAKWPGIVLVVLVLYVASYGPAMLLARYNSSDARMMIDPLYRPLEQAAEITGNGRLLNSYGRLWDPEMVIRLE